MNKLQCAITSFLTYLDTFRVTPTEITDICLPVTRIEIRNGAWASLDARSTAYAYFPVYHNRRGSWVNGDSVYGATLFAWIIITLGTEVRYL